VALGLVLGCAARPRPAPPAGSSGGKALTWRKANLTMYESYPAPGSEECIKYSGCKYEGLFAFLDGKQPQSWVKVHNIAAVHRKDGQDYRLKTLRLRHGAREIDVKVYDVCGDDDCDGCCTKNSRETGFLIDIERYTAERFGIYDTVVDWACLDCD
jgi:hypothetical protein